MFIRKSKISELIKKERAQERKRCEKEFFARLRSESNKLSKLHKETLENIENEYKRILFENEKEIKNLRKEIDKNYTKYQDIRKREKYLDELTAEVEEVIESMIIKVQESIQPFYRTRSKVEATKRRSNKKNEKVENIFRAIK